ncbi:hypothetical protein [Paraglaciecola polaris]|mgnify:CR=1 FL=1|uniref:hypothetical protein n=1 Tax=Paraglaciecola polaris TaxID=222814 RepID=UPI001D053376|nr:hypothetical protein [Paraglaciecola polaris]
MKTHTKNVYTLSLILLVVGLSGCASNEPKPIETTDKFSTQIGPEGETQFAFALSWFNLPEEESTNRGGRDGRHDGLSNRPARPIGSNFNPQPDNETKLALEDKAVHNLKNTLEKRDLCPNGYSIDDIIWESRRIRLMGACKSVASQ